MKYVKRSIQFINANDAYQLLLALAHVAMNSMYTAKPGALAPLYLICSSEKLRPSELVNFGVTYGESSKFKSASTLIGVDSLGAPHKSSLVVSDLSRESLTDILKYLYIPVKLLDKLDSAVKLKLDPENYEGYLTRIFTAQISEAGNPLSNKKDNISVVTYASEIKPKVISKQRIKDNGGTLEGLKPTPIKRHITLKMIYNRTQRIYSIGHAICMLGKDVYDEHLGETISLNRAHDKENALVWNTVSDFDRICFKDTLETEQGRLSMLESIKNDMEANFGNYVTAYNHEALMG